MLRKKLSRRLRPTVQALAFACGTTAALEASAAQTPAGFSLEITVVGGGVVSGGGLSCASQCTIVASGDLTLTAISPGPSFVGWTGDCLGLQDDTCTLVVDGNKKVTAWFEGGAGVVVEMRGDGAGRIRSTPPGIDCSSGTCSLSVSLAVPELTLSVEPEPGTTFGGWSGACRGTGTCVLSMTGTVTHAVQALLSRSTPSLRVRRTVGAITGSVTSDPPGIACGLPNSSFDDCTEDYPQGGRITLTAVPRVGLPSGARALGVFWDPACSVNANNQCVLTVDRRMEVEVIFLPLNGVDPPLNVTVVGTGRVVSNPAGIDCSAVCMHRFKGETVTLQAIPDPGSRFTGWTGDCTGPGQCIVTVDSDKNVTATFAMREMRVQVTVDRGTGSGAVQSSPSGILCPGDCEFVFAPGTTVTLTAEAFSESFLQEWRASPFNPHPNPCTASGGTCTLTQGGSYRFDLIYDLFPDALSVGLIGNGSGQVESLPYGIRCGSDCSQRYPKNTTVTLTASAGSSSRFSGWGGACSGTAPCTVTMDSSKFVTAKFEPIPHRLSVSKTGTGTGTVASAPSGILCGVDCSEDYASGTTVLLTATPDLGSTFGGWSGGGCSGTGTCSVTMDRSMLVTADFQPPRYTLSVNKTGTGTGRVGSAPSGVDCGIDCGEDYPSGTTVLLTASAFVGSAFRGWSGGGCSGTGTCSVTMDSSKEAVATFERDRYSLAVVKTGSGSGLVSSNPSGISCGNDCSEWYPIGETVTLSAAASPGSVFTGWGGVCTGLAPCQVPMNASANVAANFLQTGYLLLVGKAGAGSGTIASADGRISCGTDCSEVYSFGSSVTLSAFASPGSYFSGWSGACGGAGQCTLTMNAGQSATATFLPLTHVLSVGVSNGGFVASSPSGIFCPGHCSEPYAHSTTVSLSAVATSGWFFSGWSGACAGTGGCSLSMTGPRSVQATFIRQSFLLTVNKAGPAAASGLVTGSGINCGADCIQWYESGTTLTLLAPQLAGGVTFAGWGGDCTFAGQSSTCTITMNGPRNVTAVFTFGPR